MLGSEKRSAKSRIVEIREAARGRLRAGTVDAGSGARRYFSEADAIELEIAAPRATVVYCRRPVTTRGARNHRYVVKHLFPERPPMACPPRLHLERGRNMGRLRRKRVRVVVGRWVRGCRRSDDRSPVSASCGLWASSLTSPTRRASCATRSSHPLSNTLSRAPPGRGSQPSPGGRGCIRPSQPGICAHEPRYPA